MIPKILTIIIILSAGYTHQLLGLFCGTLLGFYWTRKKYRYDDTYNWPTEAREEFKISSVDVQNALAELQMVSKDRSN